MNSSDEAVHSAFTLAVAAVHELAAGSVPVAAPTGEPAIDWKAEAEVWADEENEPVMACSYNCRLTTLSDYCKCQGQCL